MSNYLIKPYLLILVISGLLALGSVVLIWRYRRAYSARWIILLEIAVAFWAWTAFLEGAATTIPLKYFWSKIAYLGTCFVSPFFFLFTYEYSLLKRIRWHWGWIVYLIVIPSIFCLLAFLNDYHHLLWVDLTIDPRDNIGIYQHGYLFYVMIGYAYLNLAIGFSLLLRAFYKFNYSFKAQARMLLVGTLIPIGANLLYVLGLFPIRGLEPTPFALAITSLIISLSFLLFDLFKLVPIAQESVIEVINDAVIILDKTGTIISANPASDQICQVKIRKYIGHNIASIKEINAEFFHKLTQDRQPEFDFTVVRDGQNHYYYARIFPLKTLEHSEVGQVIIISDITEHKQHALERERLITELQQALSEVKTLSGLLPICSVCKKIRDDSGYWHEVEQYISTHTDVDFSHGICPDCMRKLYPEIYERLKKKQQAQSNESPGNEQSDSEG